MIEIGVCKQIEMADVPSDVWDEVYTKWLGSLIDIGWYYWLWSRCALCDWINPDELECNKCPLNPNWCTSMAQSSKLHIKYRRSNGKTWESDIEDFLCFIEPYCSERINHE